MASPASTKPPERSVPVIVKSDGSSPTAASHTTAPGSTSSIAVPNSAAAGQQGVALTFTNIRCAGSADVGMFRMLNDNFGWRIRKSSHVASGDSSNRKTIQACGAQVDSVSWISLNAREHRLNVILQDGSAMRLDGFREADLTPIEKHIATFWNISNIPRTQVATRGWHWGHGKVEQKHFNFYVDSRLAFHLPCDKIKQVTTSKGDVCVVFDNEPAKEEQEDQLLEIRMFVPPSKHGDEDPAEMLKDSFLSVASTSTAGLIKNIATISDLKVLVPAGRFDLQVARRSIKLQGKSADFTIDLKQVPRWYLLHSTNFPHVFLVISLETPLRKGHTPYFNVVIQFEEKRSVDIELMLTEEEIAELEAENPPGLDTQLAPLMSGSEYDLVCRILRAVSGKSMTLAGAYRSSIGQSCFRSSFKAESGTVYPLEKSFVFIPKPVIIVLYEDIVSVTFGRASGSQTKLFEFHVATKQGNLYTFSSVDRQESAPLMDFLQSRDIKVRAFGREEGEGHSRHGRNLDEEDEDDEDDEEEDDEDAEENDDADDEDDDDDDDDDTDVVADDETGG